ncbi:ATPase ASNA1-like isoform X1 [Leptotrombidium deliense]|uniref:ATPase ASNA1-like isoform X1 n=1 Tax=Leptotrombidium deliense TaxID=299467 RepID=A0A443SKG6_9ACAR|nr:ATPase ASNA1-like isoform X1 [Leptotrombidium deliense]
MDKELKWIFVGGKGGVGKTTCSCSLAIELSKRRENVLLISTDPAHNVSDAFNQKLSKIPTKINGFENLFAMEIDTNLDAIEMDMSSINELSSRFGGTGGAFQELLQSFPGIDEAMSYIQVLKLIQSFNYDCVVFDTAPTGHTLRLLSLPAIIEKSFTKILSLKSTLAPIFQSFSSMLGMSANSADSVTSKIEELMPTITQINEEFSDATKTTFVCVAIAEFLSLYETERLIQSLAKCNIDCHSIIINQLLVLNESNECKFCDSRSSIQSKYLQQFIDLYEDDFDLVLVPQLLNEVRGKDELTKFSKFLFK